MEKTTVITEEAYIKYREELTNIAIENQLTIGFERREGKNPFNFYAFVRDCDDNTWSSEVRLPALDLNELFKVWQEVERLMKRLLHERIEIKMHNGSSFEFRLDSLDSCTGKTPFREQINL